MLIIAAIVTFQFVAAFAIAQGIKAGRGDVADHADTQAIFQA